MALQLSRLTRISPRERLFTPGRSDECPRVWAGLVETLEATVTYTISPQDSLVLGVEVEEGDPSPDLQ